MSEEISVSSVDFSVSSNGDSFFEGDSIRQSFITFSGADVTVSRGDKVFGSLQSFHWSEDLDDGTINGHLVFTLFGSGDSTSTLTKLTDDNQENLVFTFQNDYGDEMAYQLVNPVFYLREGGASMDDIILEEKYHFEAEKLEYL